MNASDLDFVALIPQMGHPNAPEERFPLAHAHSGADKNRSYRVLALDI